MALKRIKLPLKPDDMFKLIRFFNSRQEELFLSYRNLLLQLQDDLNITPGSISLDDLTDVNAPTPSDGDVLVYDQTAGEWVSQAPGSGGVVNLDDLGDVNAPAPADGDVLVYDQTAGEWVSQAPGSGGTGTPGGSNTHIQYNDGGAFGGDAAFTFNETTKTVSVDSLQFDITTPTTGPGAGLISYNGATGALAYKLNSSNVQSEIGETLHAFVHNAEAVTITKGQAVYLYQASGNKASVKLAYNTSDATSAKTFGLAAEDIPAGNNGFIICQGVLDGLNTGAYSAGDTLYLGATAGGYTATKPVAPNHLVYIGIVERANAGNGQIYVRTQNGYELDELHDVLISSPVNNQVLAYETGVNNLWKNKNLIDILPTSVKSGSCGVTFDGGGQVILSGKTAYVQVPYAGTITGWTIVSSPDAIGSCTVTAFKDTYANYPPTTPADNIFVTQPALSSAVKATATGLSVAVASGDWIGFTISGVSLVTWVNLTISITKI